MNDTCFDECSVCYDQYHTKTFAIVCEHSLCRSCYNLITNKICPICRCKMRVPRKYNAIMFPKGKLNLNLMKYRKIEKHLQYKYSLEGRVKNKRLDYKHMYLKFHYAMANNIDFS